MLPSMRFALCAALLAAFSFPASVQAQNLTTHEAFARDVFRELIDINTTHSAGRAALDAVVLRRVGVSVSVAEGAFVGGCDVGGRSTSAEAAEKRR